MGTKVDDIPQIREVYYSTYASFPTSGLKVSDLAFATDRLVLYRWNGSSWNALTYYCSSGADASKPTASDLPDGSLYYATDTSILYQVQSGSWANILSSPVFEVKTKKETRDMTAAAGDVSYTGYGFQPSGLIILAYLTISATSVGKSAPDKTEACLYLYPSSPFFYADSTYIIKIISPSVGVGQNGLIKSYDADGFTLTWDKGGVPTGTIHLFITAFRN